MSKKPTYEELEKKVQELEASIASCNDDTGHINRMLNCSPSVIYTKDLQGRYTTINHQFEYLSGFKREDVINKTDFELFPISVAQNSTSNDRQVLETGTPLETEEFAPVHGHGQMHSFTSTKYPLINEDGNIYGICGVSIDITDKKETEEALRKTRMTVKILSGLLPICSFCKKIRDDKGYWNQIENYIREHSEAEFSHSLCKECAKIHYPEFDIYDN